MLIENERKQLVVETNVNNKKPMSIQQQLQLQQLFDKQIRESKSALQLKEEENAKLKKDTKKMKRAMTEQQNQAGE